MHALHYRRNAFQAHTCIHRRLGQRVHHAVFITIKLHKHAVPNFNKTIAVFVCRTWHAAPNFFAMIIKYFRTRTARSCIAHLPKIIGRIFRTLIIAYANYLVFRQPDFITPNRIGFIIFRINRCQKFLFGQIQPFGRSEKFPRKMNRIAFKIIAETEIA